MPVQLRFDTGLAGAEYVTRELWRRAILPRCPLHPRGGCGLARHGSYARKRPAGTRIARWYCPQGHRTFSLLPDHLAARFPGTLVFYMGVSGLVAITEGLLDGGRSESEPAAVISNGTLPDQATIVAPLGQIAAVAAEAQVRPPAITDVGDVASLSAKLSWSKLR